MKKIFIITAIMLIVTSCSPKIIGTWNIDRYEVDNQQGQNHTTRNAGVLTIKKNGTGEKNVQYNMFQNEFNDRDTFRWNMQGDDIITLSSSQSGPGQRSEFDKTWIMVTNTKKKQVWKSTDGRNSVQTLEMSKQ